ncbi:hypothetical protein [Legionella sp.]|uniref:hypothetical protein n=1 Tax=Legionella sp. TaxID=459 RepID=UPI003C8549C0
MIKKKQAETGTNYYFLLKCMAAITTAALITAAVVTVATLKLGALASAKMMITPTLLTISSLLPAIIIGCIALAFLLTCLNSRSNRNATYYSTGYRSGSAFFPYNSYPNTHAHTHAQGQT